MQFIAILHSVEYSTRVYNPIFLHLDRVYAERQKRGTTSAEGYIYIYIFLFEKKKVVTYFEETRYRCGPRSKHLCHFAVHIGDAVCPVFEMMERKMDMKTEMKARDGGERHRQYCINNEMYL